MPVPPVLPVLCCLLLLLVPDSRQLSITELVVPSAVEAGNNAELHCSFSSDEALEYVKWWWTPLYVATDDRNPVLLYQRLNGQPEPQIPRKNIEWKGNDTIVISELQAKDSGTYECDVSSVDEVRQHSSLIVYSNGTDLLLNVTEVADGPDADDDEDVLVQCEAHDVTPQPELSISVDGREIANVSLSVVEGAGGVWSAAARAALSAADARGKDIRCELFFADKNIIHPPYVETLFYTSGAGLSTTETPEDTTHSEVASELQNTSGVTDLRASIWIPLAVAVVRLYVLS